MGVKGREGSCEAVQQGPVRQRVGGRSSSHSGSYSGSYSSSSSSYSVTLY